MSIVRPFYGLHRIDKGKYTNGNELVIEDGTDYVGTYHILPNNQKFTFARPEINSVELFEKRFDLSDSVIRYNFLNDKITGQYISPFPIQPIPELDQYEDGEFERYFVQKRNNPRVTIVQIDSDQ